MCEKQGNRSVEEVEKETETEPARGQEERRGGEERRRGEESERERATEQIASSNSGKRKTAKNTLPSISPLFCLQPCSMNSLA